MNNVVELQTAQYRDRRSVEEIIESVTAAIARGGTTNIVVVRFEGNQPYTSISSGITLEKHALTVKLIEADLMKALLSE